MDRQMTFHICKLNLIAVGSVFGLIKRALKGSYGYPTIKYLSKVTESSYEI
jgi:hypothetical protein